MAQKAACGFPTCEFGEAMVGGDGEVKTVPVSPDADTVLLRPTCRHCEEAYQVGVQYGRYRAVRMLRDSANVARRFVSDRCSDVIANIPDSEVREAVRGIIAAFLGLLDEMANFVGSDEDPGLAKAVPDPDCETEDDETLAPDD